MSDAIDLAWLALHKTDLNGIDWHVKVKDVRFFIQDLKNNNGNATLTLMTGEEVKVEESAIQVQAQITAFLEDFVNPEPGFTYLELTDGATAPGAGSGVARVYVDAADGDLKVVYADSTVKTIVVDT
jgi:hypothetical protein